MDIDASSYVGLTESAWFDSNHCNETSGLMECSFHEAIFSPPSHPLFQPSHQFLAASLNVSAVSSEIPNNLTHSNTLPSPKAGNCGGGGEIGYEWNSEGKGSAYICIEVSDDKGHYAEGEIRKNDDGSGKATISGGKK